MNYLKSKFLYKMDVSEEIDINGTSVLKGQDICH